jgi:hypothetical protein
LNEGRRKTASCQVCTIHPVRLCYEHKLWFRWVREPLALGMRLLARWHHIDPHDYPVRMEECFGRLRFLKKELKEKSPLFVRLNDLVNPTFNRLRDSIVTKDEIEEARSFAREATGQGNGQGAPSGAVPVWSEYPAS